MAADAVDHLQGEVEAAALTLKELHDAGALLVVGKEASRDSLLRVDPPPAGKTAREGPLPLVAKGRVSEVVPQGDGLRQVLVEPQGPGDGAGNLCHLEGVDEARAIVVAFRRKKDLRLVGKPAEALAVEDAVPIALEASAQGVGLLEGGPSQGLIGQAPKRTEKGALPLLEVNPADKYHRASK